MYSQERDKFYMSRIVVLELLQALKFKSPLPDTNLLLLVQVNSSTIKTTCGKDFNPKVPKMTLQMYLLTMCGCCQFVCSDIGTRLAESTILSKHMISSLPGVRQYIIQYIGFLCSFMMT